MYVKVLELKSLLTIMKPSTNFPPFHNPALPDPQTISPVAYKHLTPLTGSASLVLSVLSYQQFELYLSLAFR